MSARVAIDPFFPLLPMRNLMEVLVGTSDLLMLWSAGMLRNAPVVSLFALDSR